MLYGLTHRSRSGPTGRSLDRRTTCLIRECNLVYVPALVVKQGDRQYELPAHYDAVEPVKTFAFGAAPDEYVSQFFTDVSIYPPSRFNSDFLIRINDTLAFTPIFSAEGSPGFAGSSIDSKETATSPSQLKLPWTFQGYISI